MYVFLPTAASYCSLGSPDTETSQALDMAVCHYPSSMLYLDDRVTDSWVISKLAQLDVYHHSQYFFLSGHVLLGCFLPCFFKGTAATQTIIKVHLHQRDCFLQLLAGRCLVSHSSLDSLNLIIKDEREKIGWFAIWLLRLPFAYASSIRCYCCLYFLLEFVILPLLQLMFLLLLIYFSFFFLLRMWVICFHYF